MMASTQPSATEYDGLLKAKTPGPAWGVGVGASAYQKPPTCVKVPPLICVPAADWPAVPETSRLPPPAVPPPPAMTLRLKSKVPPDWARTETKGCRIRVAPNSATRTMDLWGAVASTARQC